MPGPSKRQLILVTAAAVPCVVVGAIWMARASLGVWAATDYLRRLGVPAQIRIDRLSATGFTGSALIGPAGDPDLAIDRIEADYALFPDRRFAPRIGAVRLSGVRLKASFDGKALKFGALQPLVDQALAAPPSGAPGPRVQFDAASVRLATPAGLVVLTGQGLLDKGRLLGLTAALAAPRLAQGEMEAGNVRGVLTAAGGDRLEARLTLTADAAKAGDAQGAGLALRANLAAPYGRDPTKLFDGPAALNAALQAAKIGGAGWTAASATARLEMTGTTSGGPRDLGYAGRLALAAESDEAARDGARLDRPSFTVSSEQARLSGGGAFAASAPLTLRAAAESGQVKLTGRTLRLDGVAVRAAGPASLGGEGLTADLSGGGEARGSLSTADAAGLADQIAPAGALPDLNAALRRALVSWSVAVPRLRATADGGVMVVRLQQAARADFHDGSLVLAAADGGPLAASGPSGTSGAARLSLAGAGMPTVDLALDRYRLTPKSASADAHLAVKGDLAPSEGLDVAADLRVVSLNGATSVRMNGCTPLSASMLKAGTDPLLKEIKAALCPSPSQPLVALDRRGWRVAVQIQNADFALPAAQANVAGASVTLALAAKGAAKPGGTFDLSGARLTDASAAKGAASLYAPMTLAGRFTLAGDRVQGRLGAGLAGRPGELAAFDVAHDLPSGEGHAVLTPTPVAFAKGGLQPADIAPSVAPFFSQAAGAVEIGGAFAWGKAGVTASAHAASQGLDFNAAGGRVTGVKGSVDLPSLLPAIVSAPNQHLTAARFETVVPVTDIDLRFALTADALDIASMRATLAEGTVSLDPLALPLTPGKTASSTLHAANVDIDEVIAAVNLADSVTMRARIEASLPFSLTPEGLRFANGRIAAMGPGRLSIKRSALAGVASGGAATAQASAPGAPPASVPATNAVQDFAYQALENMAFDSLDATVDSRPQGRLGVVFHVKGRNDPPKDLPARIGVIDLIRGTAFDKPIPLPKGTPVDLTLDTSLNFDDLMAAYGQASRSGGVQP